MNVTDHPVRQQVYNSMVTGWELRKTALMSYAHVQAMLWFMDLDGINNEATALWATSAAYYFETRVRRRTPVWLETCCVTLDRSDSSGVHVCVTVHTANNTI